MQKSRLKPWDQLAIFLVSGGQKIKNITKIKQNRLFMFLLLFSFFMAFLAVKLIYIINLNKII